MKNFWGLLPKPIFALAPMEDVTDAAFRRLIARYGKPAVMFTEFTSADGLVLAPPEAQKMLRKKLIYDESERPIVAQLFSAIPERMERAAALVQELGFDGLDINMGCPVDDVVKSGCGAALINDPLLAQELIRAGRRGAPHLPISVKTRIGYRENTLDTWLPTLLSEGIAAITIHARTRNEMSAVPAHWDAVAQAVQIRDRLRSKTLILGNGDARDLAHAQELARESGADGIMLGRAIYGNPWLFSNRTSPPSPQERIGALIEHLELFDELLSDTTHYAVMKKHFKAYISGWDGAKELRIHLMETQSSREAKTTLERAISHFS
ncbi:tRNA-dihydrouridine synthase [Candidatus Kaiserbacteria bacterium]|nr:tRNA-dihydrouridine synthase [Candidatus Kaiserbacteria bacterium]